MLVQYVQQLQAKRIILASASPRRRELLGNLGLKFEVVVSDFDENLPKDKFRNGAAYAMETARMKALDVAKVCAKQGGAAVDMIISADTVVELGSEILEKPSDDEHAFRMLSSLSGKEHQVHTGVVIILPGVSDSEASGQPPLVRAFSSTTSVTFDQLSEQDIRAYIATGEPFGKAGSYGIQGVAGSFVTGLRGCYFNVMGFPVHRFGKEVVSLIQAGDLALA